MLIRQYITFCCAILILIPVHELFAQDDDTVDEEIRQLTLRMEDYFENKKMDSLGMLYHKKAYLLTPDETVKGRKKIKKYWTNIKRPVSWELETIGVSLNEDDIYQNAYYQALKTKPPGWRQRGIELDDDEPRIYQLGHSVLTTLNEEGIEQISEVDFILVWQVQPDGSYLILMDTYTWQ